MDGNVDDNGVQDDYMDSDEDNELPAAKELPAVAKFEVPFNSSREAEIARNSLQVDPEPKRGGSMKNFLVKDNILCVEIRSVDVRQLRSAVCSFMDLLNLVTKTIDQFGPPLQQSKKMT
ncbi:uncharacterized protein LOC122257071 isoform X3 [Penaeus japonicus]|uniref:uncharacterized protein LOC122257071 isoform X3 n=1 Tax=Penaeus japonicus TaxID=27405 RepID=UPI001C7154AA|nr:uncharacterized protein LOC122257071 isoform X3 [Penaeus japonicus]